MPDGATYNKSKADVPLLSIGKKQSQLTAEYLIEYLQDHGYAFDTIEIECSPFIKCMQTAAIIASQFGVQKVTINYTLTQHLHPSKVHYYNPMEHLEITRANFDFKKLKNTNEKYSLDTWFPQDVEFVDPGDF